MHRRQARTNTIQMSGVTYSPPYSLVSNHTKERQEILSDGIVIHDTEKFEIVRKMVFHGEFDA